MSDFSCYSWNVDKQNSHFYIRILDFIPDSILVLRILNLNLKWIFSFFLELCLLEFSLSNRGSRTQPLCTPMLSQQYVHHRNTVKQILHSWFQSKCCKICWPLGLKHWSQVYRRHIRQSKNAIFFNLKVVCMEGVYVKKNKCELTQTADVASRYLHQGVKSHNLLLINL